MNSLRVALGFLTVLPVRSPVALAPGELSRAAGWFPAVGLLLGGLLALTATAARGLFPPYLEGALVVVLWTLLTGALHLDGLSDCCDALFVPASRARRLEILRDPRIGSFGAAGLACFLLLKTTAVAALPGPWPLLVAPAIGRWSVLLAAVQPNARTQGLGVGFSEGLDRRLLAAAAATAALAAGACGWRGLLAFVTSQAGVLGLVWLARRRLGGVTGDVIGATCEVSELLVLLAFAAAGVA